MNLEMLRAERQKLVDEMKELVDGYKDRSEDFNDEDQNRFDELDSEIEELDADIKKLEKRQKRIDRLNTSNEEGDDRRDKPLGGWRTDSDWDVNDLRWDTTPNELRSRAQKAIEKDEHLPDQHKEAAIQVLRKIDKRGELATLILVTGHPDYRSAFPKAIVNAYWAMSQDEQRALMRAQAIGSGGAGGFAVPFTLDPTIVWTNDGSINPMRQIATVRTTTTEDWNGVTSAGATAHWRNEAEEAEDDSITLLQPNIPVHKMDLFVPYSIEIEMDWPQMEGELREAMQDAKERKEATAHWTGTGSDQPTGLITALAAASPSVTVAPATAEVFAQGDVYNLRRQLPARYRMTRDMPSWGANIGTYDAIRQFDTGGGGGFWTDMNDGTPDRLLSYRTYENSVMDDAQDIDPSATDTTNRILVVGDFKRYYIVDRVGMRMETIPHLFHTANNRPRGQRGLYAILRTGADSIDDNAFRLLNIPTTA